MGANVLKYIIKQVRRKEKPNWITRPISTVLFIASFQGHIPGRAQSDSGKSLLRTFDSQMPVIRRYSCLYVSCSESYSVLLWSVLDCLIIFRQSAASLTKWHFSFVSNVQISTVDAFQGGEKDVIILSCVRTDHIGFIDCDRWGARFVKCCHILPRLTTCDHVIFLPSTVFCCC